MISMIWCEDKCHGIGIDNSLPWNIKEEMNHFRKTTMNQIVVCGDKTFMSWGGKPLPHRENVVLTLDENFKAEGVKIYHNIDEVVKDYKDKHIFIIGGKSIYLSFLPYANELIISTLHDSYNCNLFMQMDLSKFHLDHTENHDLFDVNYYKRNK